MCECRGWVLPASSAAVPDAALPPPSMASCLPHHLCIYAHRRMHRGGRPVGPQPGLHQHRASHGMLRCDGQPPIIAVLLLRGGRSEEHTSELQSLMRISYAVFCLKKKKQTLINNTTGDM